MNSVRIPADHARGRQQGGRTAASHSTTRAAGVVGVAALLLGLAACGNSTSSSKGSQGAGGHSTSSGGRSLTVQVQTGEGNLLDCYIDLFKKQNSGVSVTTSTVSQTAKNGSNLEVLTSSNPPDVGMIPTNSEVYSRMVTAHELTPLTSVWSADDLRAAYGSRTAPLFESQGTPYVVSMDDSYYDVVYYNKSLFAKAGITAPANHLIPSVAALSDYAKKLTHAGSQGLAIAGSSGYQASWLVDNFLNTSATPGEYANYLSSWQKTVPMTAKYTAAPFVNALTAIDQLGKDGVFQPGYLGVSQVPEVESLFATGKAGMLLDGEWTVAQTLQKQAHFPFGWLVLPPIGASSRKNTLSLYAGDTIGIPTKAPNKALAEKFLEVVGSKKGQLCNLSTGYLPGINTLPARDYSKLPTPVQQMIALVRQNGAQTGWTSGVPGGVGQSFTDPLVQSMLNGQLTPQEVAEKVESNALKYKSGK